VSADRRRAWYLKISAAPPPAVLVGDRGRVLVAAELLDRATLLNEDRGLTTVLGRWGDIDVIVSAFGMGAPIAAIVMHELAAVGSTTFVRAGTMMTRRPPLGTFIVAERALIHEGTSATYGNVGGSIELDAGLASALAEACGEASVVRGTVASCDGFYTQMTDLLAATPTALTERWDAEQVIGIDMETSALATVAAALGVAFGSLCLATVDVDGPVVLDAAGREAGEAALLRAALDVVTTTAPGAPSPPPTERGDRR
jgi:uridine phosphorylase